MDEYNLLTKALPFHFYLLKYLILYSRILLQAFPTDLQSLLPIFFCSYVTFWRKFIYFTWLIFHNQLILIISCNNRKGITINCNIFILFSVCLMLSDVNRLSRSTLSRLRTWTIFLSNNFSRQITYYSQTSINARYVSVPTSGLTQV